MIKSKELSDPNSCFNRADEDEWVFVFLGRDAATPAAIRGWASKRIELGKNEAGDFQITEALKAASKIEADQVEEALEAERREIRAELGKS